MRRGRMIHDDATGARIQDGGVESQDAHVAFAVDRDRSGVHLFVRGHEFDGTHDVPDLHRFDGRAEDFGGPFQCDPVAVTDFEIRGARLQHQDFIAPEQGQQLVKVDDRDVIVPAFDVK